LQITSELVALIAIVAVLTMAFFTVRNHERDRKHFKEERQEWKEDRKEMLNRIMARDYTEYVTLEGINQPEQVIQVIDDEDEAEYLGEV